MSYTANIPFCGSIIKFYDRNPDSYVVMPKIMNLDHYIDFFEQITFGGIILISYWLVLLPFLFRETGPIFHQTKRRTFVYVDFTEKGNVNPTFTDLPPHTRPYRDMGLTKGKIKSNPQVLESSSRRKDHFRQQFCLKSMHNTREVCLPIFFAPFYYRRFSFSEFFL